MHNSAQEASALTPECGEFVTRLEQAVQERTETLRADIQRLESELLQCKATEGSLRQVQEREQAFLAVLGHELRNPLGPLRNSAAICAMVGEHNPELIAVSEIIERQVRTLAQMVDDLIDVSHIAQGRIKIQKEPVCLSQLLEQVVADSRLSSHEQSRELHLESPSNAVWVEGDAVRLKQVVVNLLRYLSKSSTVIEARSGIALSLVSLPQLQEVVLKFRDPGATRSGAAPAPSTTNVSTGGASRFREKGLSITLVQGLVDLHGGTIDFSTPIPGRGEVITVRLPWIQSPGHVCEAESSGGLPTNGQSRRIVIIDEHADFLATMERLLEHLGHHVITTTTVENGLILVKQTRPDVIVSAIGLQETNGYELARQVRAEPTLESTFLVAVTGFGQEDDHRRALAAGFDRHLIKPVAVEQLVQLLNALGDQ